MEGSNIDALQKLNTPDTHITLAQKLAVFSNALANTDEGGLGWRVGQQARFSDFGVLGYAVFRRETLLDAYRLIWAIRSLQALYLENDVSRR